MHESLYTFEIAIHHRAEPATATLSGPEFADAWGTWPTLAVDGGRLALPMAIGCEAALGNLARLERMFVEPDGSFVWTSPDPGRPWQVDGNVIEWRERVLAVEAKGCCPPSAFDALLGAFGWPGQALMMQLVRPAVFLDEPTFRLHAARRGAEGAGQVGQTG